MKDQGNPPITKHQPGPLTPYCQPIRILQSQCASQAPCDLTAGQSAPSNRKVLARPSVTLLMANRHHPTGMCQPGHLAPYCRPISTLQSQIGSQISLGFTASQSATVNHKSQTRSPGTLLPASQHHPNGMHQPGPLEPYC